MSRDFSQEDYGEEKGVLLEEKARILNEKEMKVMEDFFNFQNDVLSELGLVIQKRMERSNAEVQQQLSDLYEIIQQNADFTKKLHRIHIQTNSLHEAVVRPQ